MSYGFWFTIPMIYFSLNLRGPLGISVTLIISALFPWTTIGNILLFNCDSIH